MFISCLVYGLIDFRQWSVEAVATISLMKDDGSPFFYLADTAWSLFHRLDFAESNEYLRDRAAKGFTVIQAVALAEHGGLTVPNRNGDLPLENNDPLKPNEKYFAHVDRVVAAVRMALR